MYCIDTTIIFLPFHVVHKCFRFVMEKDVERLAAHSFADATVDVELKIQNCYRK